MFITLKKIWDIIPQRRKKNYLKLILLAVLLAIFEALIIMLLGLLLSIIFNPKIIEKLPISNFYLNQLVNNPIDINFLILGAFIYLLERVWEL